MDNELHMTTGQLREWQEHMGYTSVEAADALDLHLNTFLNYRRGYRTMSKGDSKEVLIPQGVAMNCVTILLGVGHYDEINLADYPQ